MKFTKIVLVFSLIVFSGCASIPKEDPTSFKDYSQGDQNLTKALEIASKKYNIPGLSLAIVDPAGLKSIGVYGVRRNGALSPITIQDKWLLGSDAKAITAAVVAKLVEEGKLTWETTVADIFPEYRNIINEGFIDLDMINLLSHRGGLPREDYDFFLLLEDKLNPENDEVQARKKFLLSFLSRKPLFKVGTEFRYSNAGYMIVGAIIEKVTGKTYQQNVQELIFTPLGMNNSGFGGIGTPGIVDQPWGHNKFGEPDNINGQYSDNLPSIGFALTALTPAGRIHTTMQDWSKFIADNLRYFVNTTTLLEKSSYARIFKTDDKYSYALGWILFKDYLDGHDVYAHDGSNGHYAARVGICPDKQIAFLITCNQGVDNPKIREAMDGITRRIIDLIISEEKNN